MIPHIRVRLNGVLQELPIPSTPHLVITIPPPNSQRRYVEDIDFNELGLDPSLEDEDIPDNVEDFFANEDEFEEEEEDGPDWLFDDEERRFEDPEYTFCPAPHRRQILHLIASHFCRHSIFLEPDQVQSATKESIRQHAVYEMYKFCEARGLREVWGYMWTQWYSPQQWALWARSTSFYLSRLRTTMGVENFWRQLKHNFLHHLVRPRLDQLVWILATQVLPAWTARAEVLKQNHRAGRSRALTTYQLYFKKTWRRYEKATVSGRVYATNVERWQCNCGRQKFDAHGLCKHLVQSVPKPPIEFFQQVTRRRTIPIYHHPSLRTEEYNSDGVPTMQPYEDIAGSITDGDDWDVVDDSHSLLQPCSLGKRKAVNAEDFISDADLDHGNETSSGFESDNEEEVSHCHLDTCRCSP